MLARLGRKLLVEIHPKSITSGNCRHEKLLNFRDWRDIVMTGRKPSYVDPGHFIGIRFVSPGI